MRIAALMPSGTPVQWDVLQVDPRYQSALRTIASLMHA
jgi:hypothetical protein